MKLSAMVGCVVGLVIGAGAMGQTPDPATVVREGAGYKYPQAGWWVVHVEGAPYERGVQQGKLLAEEIAGYVRCLAMTNAPSAPDEGMKLLRTIVNANFLRGFERESLEEMKGIADGAAAAGAKFNDRAVDLTDIVALNVWAELGALDDGLNALPMGLEGVRFPEEVGARARPAPEGHCSAFAATGPATKDGHAMIGHITMFGLYPSDFFNVWLDVKPERGHRIVMQGFPGAIQSSMDYYQNDAGIVLVETTIDQTRFDKTGLSLASRVRQAVQYADSIDEAVRLLDQPGNGLYTNEWLLADMKTDEIAMFEQGTHTSHLWRSGPGGKGAKGKPAEWFGGTEGFYWGCNNTKDIGVRLEGIAALNDTPQNVVWHPADRDVAWVNLYKQYKGKMDGEFGKIAFTTRPICGSASLDAKFTTRDMAREMKAWATFGPPRGMTWEPTLQERKKYPEIKALVSNPWTVLGPAEEAGETETAAVDFAPVWGGGDKGGKDDDDQALRAAWRGTILPRTDADIWLAASFAEFQRLVAEERGMAEAHEDKCLCDTDHDKAASSLHAARARYLAAARAGGDVALSKIKRGYDSSDWYDIAAGKGVLVLSELRLAMGDEAFAAMMDGFGRRYAGQEVATADFVSAVSAGAGKDMAPFFDRWLSKPGMPTLTLREASLGHEAALGQGGGDERESVRGVLSAEGGELPGAVEMTVEWDGGEATQVVTIGANGAFTFTCDQRPKRLVVDKYERSARANGGAAGIGTFTREIEKTIIVYGTKDDAAANQDAAARLQRALQQAWFNWLVPMKADTAVSETELKGNSVVLIGRPATNSVASKCAGALPVKFGARSFSVRGDVYGHPLTAVIAAAASPWNPAMSVTIFAGNDAESTVRSVEGARRGMADAEVQVLTRDGDRKSVVVPPEGLVKEFEK